MSKEYKDFEPNWYTDEAPKKSWRSIFKWGDPKFSEFPKETLYKMIKEKFELEDSDFEKYQTNLGLDEVKLDRPTKLTQQQQKELEEIVGKDNVSYDEYDRLSVAYGKTMIDLIRLRDKIVDSMAEAVLYPSEVSQIQKIIDFAYKYDIPVYVYGGGSSVTRGVEPVKGGLSIDMRRNFNKVIDFNETNQTITVMSGLSGPDLEDHLRNAKEEYGAKEAYTCGHFPQSFEYSSVGGWVVTRGAGQNSTYYGKIEDLVLAQEYATPRGIIKTDAYARKATGPSIDQLMMGNEGAFGILSTVTLKFFKYRPQNHYRFSWMFPSWENARAAAREIMQGEFGFPSVFRLSDAEETDIMLKLYGIEDTPLKNLLKIKGYKPMERCLFLGFTDGEQHFCKNIKKQVHNICKKYGAMYLTGLPVKGWEKGRFNDPYLRDTMQDYGIVTDTLECTVNWDNMEYVHKLVGDYCKSRPNTICMTHMSHAYPQGANLYWIFITKCTDMEEFKQYHSGILDHIQKSGAAISHHHGIGKLFAPWLEGCIGSNQMDILKLLKNYFDEKNLMNPGGTIGLDLKEEEKHFIREKW
jgi:alkyldihydroxyacetonephosphate synthase